MSTENTEMEVLFGQYCHSCKYFSKVETEEPCDECLEEPYNIDSHKPVNYKEEEQ